MVSPVNGAGSQTALVNPFEQKPDQQNRIGQDNKSSQGADNKTSPFRVDGQKSQSTALAQSGQTEKSQATTKGRGELVDITV